MARLGGLVLSLLVVLGACHVKPSMGVHLSTLAKTLVVTSSSSKDGQVLYTGEDKITVTWSLNTTEPAGADASYKTVKVSLCYAPVSQKDRAWRKADDDLAKDKACQFKITQQPYTAAAAAAATFEYKITRDIPTATYFVRAYALDASGVQVAYGQTAPAYFNVVGITGIHPSLDIAAGVFSAFSVAALVFFFVVENRKKNK